MVRRLLHSQPILLVIIRVRRTFDAQLEKAIEVVMQEMKENPQPSIKRPPYPNYHEKDGLGVK